MGKLPVESKKPDVLAGLKLKHFQISATEVTRLGEKENNSIRQQRPLENDAQKLLFQWYETHMYRFGTTNTSLETGVYGNGSFNIPSDSSARIQLALGDQAQFQAIQIDLPE